MGHQNGCYNRQPFQTEQQVQDGWLEAPLGAGVATRVPRLIMIPITASHKCQHDSAKDPACQGCQHQNRV